MKIRARLTLWYTTVLALCLVAFGATVWLTLRESLVTARHAELEDRMRGFRQMFLEHAAEPDASSEALREEAVEYSAALPSDFTVQLWDARGLILFETRAARESRIIERDDSLATAGQTYRLKMSASLAGVDEMLIKLRDILALSIPIALLAASLGGYWLSGRALKPVKEMALAAQSIGIGDLSARLPMPRARDELSLLASMWNDMLARLDDSVGRIRRFTSDASHDLRTPLATIRASAEIALRRPREADDYRLALNSILRQTDRATALVDSLLTLARSDHGASGLLFARLDLSLLAINACDMLQPMAQARNVVIRCTIEPGLAWIHADSESMTRVLVALIDNAIKNTHEGFVDVQLATDGQLVRILIRDTGSGIDAADLPHIFDRFYRSDQARSSASGGFGLGLAIAKEAVTLHSGSIEVESTIGKGSQFTVCLPVGQSEVQENFRINSSN